jgi:hypothetical protein
VIPDTAAALISFLALVAPGIAFHLVRERYTPARRLTAFREAGVVALTSLIFTAAATLLLLGLAATRLGERLPDLGAWVAEGDAYLDTHVVAALVGLAAEVALAMALACVAARLLSTQGAHGNISGVGTWFQAFREDRPDHATPWLRIELDDDSTVWGYLKHYSTDESFEKGELTLVGPRLALKKKNQDKVVMADWYSIMIPGPKIRTLALVYIDDRDGSLLGADRRMTPQPAEGAHGDQPGAQQGPSSKNVSALK